jgi:hypothetical protein
MFWFKACPRCQGDLYEEQDHYGKYIACLQCGHVLSDVEEVELRMASHGHALAVARVQPAVGSQRARAA